MDRSSGWVDRSSGLGLANDELNIFPLFCVVYRCVELLVNLSSKAAVSLGLQDQVCRVSLHMKGIAALKVIQSPILEFHPKLSCYSDEQ